MTAVLALITFVSALALGFVYKSTAPMIEAQKKVSDEVARRIALPQASCGVFVPVEADGFTYYKGYSDPDTTHLVGYTVKARGRGYSSTIEAIVGVDLSGRITGMKITSQQETPGLGSKVEEVKSTKTLLGLIKKALGKGETPTVEVEVAQGGQTICLEVGIRDPVSCSDLEKAVLVGDTLKVYKLAPLSLCLAPDDSCRVFADERMSFRVARMVVERLRAERTPWFQLQFKGKRYEDLVVVKEKTEKNIQAITGATISSRAVVEGVKDAIKKLERAIGGFKEK